MSLRQTADRLMAVSPRTTPCTHSARASSALPPSCGPTSGEPLGRARAARAISPSAGAHMHEGGWRPVGAAAPPGARDSSALGLRTPGTSWADANSSAVIRPSNADAALDVAMMRGRAAELGALLQGDEHALAGLLENVRRSIEDSTAALERNLAHGPRTVNADDGGSGAPVPFALLSAAQRRADAAEADLLHAQGEIAALSAELARAQQQGGASPRPRRISALAGGSSVGHGRASRGSFGADSASDVGSPRSRATVLSGRLRDIPGSPRSSHHRSSATATAAAAAAEAATEAAVAAARSEASEDQAKLAAQLAAAATALSEADEQQAALEEQLADAEASAAEAHDALESEREAGAALRARLEALGAELAQTQQQAQAHADAARLLDEERAARSVAEREASALRADSALLAQRDGALASAIAERDEALLRLRAIADSTDGLRAHAAHGIRDAASARELATAKQRELRAEVRCDRAERRGQRRRARATRLCAPHGARLRTAGRCAPPCPACSTSAFPALRDPPPGAQTVARRSEVVCLGNEVKGCEAQVQAALAALAAERRAGSELRLQLELAQGQVDGARAAAKEQVQKASAGALHLLFVPSCARGGTRLGSVRARSPPLPVCHLVSGRTAAAAGMPPAHHASPTALVHRRGSARSAPQEKERAASEWHKTTADLRSTAQRLGQELVAARSELSRVQEQRAAAWEHNEFLRTHLRQRARSRSAGRAWSPAPAEREGWSPGAAERELSALSTGHAPSPRGWPETTASGDGLGGGKDVMMLESALPHGSPLHRPRETDEDSTLHEAARPSSSHAPRALASSPPASWPTSPYARTPAAGGARGESPARELAACASGVGQGGSVSTSAGLGGSRLPPPSARMLKVAQERLASRSKQLATGNSSRSLVSEATAA